MSTSKKATPAPAKKATAPAPAKAPEQDGPGVELVEVTRTHPDGSELVSLGVVLARDGDTVRVALLPEVLTVAPEQTRPAQP